MKNRKFLFRNKIQPINTEATTLELVIYGGSLPMIAEGFKWKDIELINSVKKSTTEQLSKSTTQRLLSIQGRFKSMVGFVEQFSHLEEVLIYIEVRETELHQVQSSTDLARLKYLLGLPGARVYIRFQLTKENPEHPTSELIQKWKYNWEKALEMERPLYLPRKEKPEPKWPLSKSS